jgi:hypothetical protein
MPDVNELDQTRSLTKLFIDQKNQIRQSLLNLFEQFTDRIGQNKVKKLSEP